MTLYTPVPLETVFEGMEEYKPQYMDIRINGIEMQVERVNGMQARVVRLLSGNPNDYLNPAYCPGAIIEFQPTISG